MLRAARKAALCSPSPRLVSCWPSSPQSWLFAGLLPQKQWGGLQGLGCERPLEGARSEEVLSGVYVYGGGIQGSGVGIPSLQEAGGSGGWGALLTETHHLFYWPWGTLHKETSPSLLAPTSWALGWVGEGRSGSGNVGGTYQRIQGQGLGEGRHSKLALSFLHPDWGRGPLLQL